MQLRALKASVLVKGREIGLGLSVDQGYPTRCPQGPFESPAGHVLEIAQKNI